MHDEISIPVHWGKLTAKAWGSPEGMPVLSLHGWLDNAASFDALAPRFASTCRWVALDLPGHGYSDHRPAGTSYHLVDVVSDLLMVVRHLGWKRFQLVGHSLGGIIATLFAASFPHEIEKLVLIESPGPLPAPPSEFPKNLGKYAQEILDVEAKQLPIYESLEQAARARAMASPLSFEASMILAARGTVPVENGLTWRTDKRLRISPALRFTEEQSIAVLEQIQAPSLLVMAETGFPIKDTQWKHRLTTHLKPKIVSVPGQHHAHLENPEPVAVAIGEFFRSDKRNG